eukprot:5079277-Pyramimonas_sp.AAC.1
MPQTGHQLAGPAVRLVRREGIVLKLHAHDDSRVLELRLLGGLLRRGCPARAPAGCGCGLPDASGPSLRGSRGPELLQLPVPLCLLLRPGEGGKAARPPRCRPLGGS